MSSGLIFMVYCYVMILILFQADKMHWIVDKVPDKSLLNTAGWKYIVPQLYKQYPDDDMNLNISVYSPPLIRFEKAQVAVTVPLDVIINVLDGGETIPVACVSVVSFWKQLFQLLLVSQLLSASVRC